MGLEEVVAANGHRYNGLRAFGFGASLEMNWPEHPTFPNYGYTITRFDLDGLVARKRGDSKVPIVLDWRRGTSTSSTQRPAREGALNGAAGVVVKRQGRLDDERDPRTLRRRRRRPELAARPRARRRAQPRLADGHGAARLLHERAPRRALDRLAPRHPATRTARSCPATAGSFPWATGGSTSASDCSRRAARGRASTRRSSRSTSSPRSADAWGLSDETCCGPPTGGTTADGSLDRTARRREHAHHRRRRRRDQPLQR